jgi:hypothetical protein
LHFLSPFLVFNPTFLAGFLTKNIPAKNVAQTFRGAKNKKILKNYQIK